MFQFLSRISDSIRSLFGTDKNSVVATPMNGPSTAVKEYRMNYFDPAENSNKVWIGIAYSDGKFETRFGRVRDEAKLASKQKQFATQMTRKPNSNESVVKSLGKAIRTRSWSITQL